MVNGLLYHKPRFWRRTMTDSFDYESIAKMIDHSLLNPSLTTAELEEGIALAIRYNVASVCIVPFYLARCAELLAGTTVHASTTIGFPHGGHTTAIKLAEVLQALADGGQELDVVINIGKARSGDWQYVRRELAALVEPIHAAGAKVKVILKMPILTMPQGFDCAGFARRFMSTGSRLPPDLRPAEQLFPT
jgi:deoxyribose-phosphate aldolase